MQFKAVKSAALIAGSALALVACGGNGGSVTDAARTASGTDAQTAILASSGQTQDAAALGMVGQSLGASLSAGDTSGIDISGLPAPTHSFSLRRAQTGALGFKTPVSTGAALGPSSGCVTPDTSSGAAQARFDSFGQNGCTASDHVEVTYVNGDEVSYTFTDTSVSIHVTGGAYAGSSVTYTFASTDSSTDVTITGVLMYSGEPAPEHIQFNSHLHAGGNQDNGDYTLTGDSTDFINLRHVQSDLRLTITNTGGGNSGSADIVWAGNATITKLDDQGAELPAGKVEWKNISLTEQVSSTTSSNSVQFLGSGQILFEGKQVGQIVTENGQFEIQWSDGVTTPFDFSVFFQAFIF